MVILTLTLPLGRCGQAKRSAQAARIKKITCEQTISLLYLLTLQLKGQFCFRPQQAQVAIQTRVFSEENNNWKKMKNLVI